MSIIHRFKDHIFSFKMTAKAWLYLSFDKVMNDYVFTYSHIVPNSIPCMIALATMVVKVFTLTTILLNW